MDDDLVGFRSGDPDAVRAVYRRYAGPVHTVARAIVGDDRELCADVVQQTFLKAWRAADRLDVDRPIAPWLYAIARRTAIDALRRERHPTRGGAVAAVDVPVGVMEVPVDPPSMERTWALHELRRALDGLPEEERQVVRLSHLEGLTHHEIAARLGVPVGTVKSRSHRAIGRLGRALAHLTAPSEGENRPPHGAVQAGEDR